MAMASQILILYGLCELRYQTHYVHHLKVSFNLRLGILWPATMFSIGILSVSVPPSSQSLRYFSPF